MLNIKNMTARIARVRLRDRHEENLHKKLEVLRAEQGVTRADTKIESSQAQESEPSVKQDEPSTSAAVEKNENNQSE